MFDIPRGTGSGFAWDERGHIVTNFHVVAGAAGATVRLSDGRDVAASLVGVSPDHDLTVIKVDVPKPPRPLPIGTSQDLRVGQKTFAIGNPFGLDWTLTTGIVSPRSIAARPRRPSHRTSHSNGCRHQPGKLRRTATGQRGPLDWRQYRDLQSVWRIRRSRLRGARGYREPRRAPAHCPREVLAACARHRSGRGCEPRRDGKPREGRGGRTQSHARIRCGCGWPRRHSNSFRWDD
jgi:Trypsin-like peptidase domain